MENYSPFHNDDKFKEEIRKPCIYFAYCFHITVITKAITIPIIKIYYGYLIISILGWLTLKRIMTMVSSFQTILKDNTLVIHSEPLTCNCGCQCSQYSMVQNGYWDSFMKTFVQTE